MMQTPHLRATQRYAGRIQIEIHCRRCHASFVPTSEAIRAGVWQTCPSCQAARREEAIATSRAEVRKMREELAAGKEPGAPFADAGEKADVHGRGGAGSAALMTTSWTLGDPMDASTQRCTARSKRSGQRCKRRPAIGRTVCAAHGGKSPVGPASPSFKDGRYSKILPARLLARYHEATQDDELLALRSEVALIDSRLSDVLRRVDTGESSRVWQALGAVYAKLKAAQLVGDEVGARYAIATLGTLMAEGYSDWAAWADVRQLVQERKALVESERKYMIEAQYMIAVDQAMATMGLLVDAVRRHVTDQDTLRAVTDEFARLTGMPSPTATADC